MRDMGKAGERFFGAWCAAAGMTANGSETDQNGWDVFVEIDETPEEYDPLSLHEGLIETKIQVKSTDGVKRTVDVELSNLKKMATSALATFYVLLEFESGESPTRAYLLHIDHDLSEKILKRVSDLKSKDQTVKLNKKYMRLNFIDEVLPLSASNLKKMILAHIGPSNSIYVENKIKHLNSVGFENGKYQFQFSISGDEQLKKLIDISLGKNEIIEVENVFSSTLRFGTLSNKSNLLSDTALLSMPDVAPSEKGSLVFRDTTTGRSLTFPIDLFRSPFNSWIPEEFRKVRMVANSFELNINNYGKSFNITIKTHLLDQFPIEDTLKMFKLTQMLSAPEKIRITFNFKNLTSDLKLQSGESFPDCSAEIELLEKALKIKNYYELDTPLSLTNSELGRIHYQVRALDLLISDRLDVIRITFSSEEDIEQGTNVDCFHVCNFQMGGYVFIELTIFSGEIFTTDGKYAIIPNERKPLYKTASNIELLNIDLLTEEITRSIESHNSSRPTVNLATEFLQKLRLHQKPEPKVISGL
ncbi:hypothetical protein [Pseudomonas sp. S1_E04]